MKDLCDAKVKDPKDVRDMARVKGFEIQLQFKEQFDAEYKYEYALFWVDYLFYQVICISIRQATLGWQKARYTTITSQAEEL